jgi:hypothetical protein
LGNDARSVVIAVDASERSLDALTLGRLLEDLKAAPVVLMRFLYDPLADPADDVKLHAREEDSNSRPLRGPSGPPAVAVVRILGRTG